VSEPLKGFSSRMIIDACRPYEWMKDPAGLDSELKEALSLKWKKELFS
jgi:hypothetical protein